MSLYHLERSIEMTRREMIDAASEYPLHHPDVIYLSTTLDRLLNEYETHKGTLPMRHTNVKKEA